MSRSTSNRVPASAISNVLQMMEEAPEKTQPEKTELTLRELISKLYDSILAMKAKGYLAEDICEFLKQHGVPAIAPTTLSTYLSRESKERKKKKCKKSNQVSSLDIGASDSAIASTPVKEKQPVSNHERTLVNSSEPAIAMTPSPIVSQLPTKDVQQEKPIASTPSDGKKSRFNDLLLDHSKL